MFPDPDDVAILTPEFWLDRAMQDLVNLAPPGDFAPGVLPTARLMLSGLESRDIPPAEVNLLVNKTRSDRGLIRIRWDNARGDFLVVLVVGKSQFYYRHFVAGRYDSGRLFVDRDHIDVFRFLVRKVFPAINFVKVEERESWWA